MTDGIAICHNLYWFVKYFHVKMLKSSANKNNSHVILIIIFALFIKLIGVEKEY